MSYQKPSLVSAVFLVSGTMVGAGMLAQPVAASTVGFIPAFLILLMAWIFMTLTALILAEACIHEKKAVHIISLSRKYLGPAGMFMAWVTYLFIGTFSLVAYISGGGDVLASLFPRLGFMSFFLFMLSCGSVLLFKEVWIAKINKLFFWVLISSYAGIVMIGLPFISVANLELAKWQTGWNLLPLFLTSFSFQMIVPNLAHYLEYQRRKLYIAILAGTTLSWIFYTLWNLVVLGSVGARRELIESFAEGRLPLQPIANHAGETSWFALTTHGFSFFALTTSFLGIGWGLIGFLADGFGWSQSKARDRGWLWLVTMVPCAVAATIYPQGFIGALDLTGGYGDTILNGLMPIGIIWSLRKKQVFVRGIISQPWVLVLLAAFAFTVIGIQTLGFIS